MVIIEINNSYSQIKGLPSGPFAQLRIELSYSPDAQGAFFSGRGYNTLRYCIDKQGTFATGLLPRVYDFILRSKIPIDIRDLRMSSLLKIHKVNHKPDFKKIVPYTFQEEAVKVAIDQHRGIISAPTGSGKSLIIALIASRLSVKTLVVVPSLQIKEQLTDSLKGFFGDMGNITVENIDSKALKTTKGYACLIIDEGHHVAARTYQKLNKTVWKDIYYRFFMTATPFRNQTEETLLFEGIAGQVIYNLSYQNAVKNGCIVPVEAYYLESPKIKNDCFTWPETYSQLVTHNETKNEIIAKTLLNLSLAEVSTLCLVKEIKHGNILADLTGLPFINGQDEESRECIELFNRGEIKTIIATEGIMGEGVDTKACEYVIIAGLGKAKSALMQKVGRCLRTYPGKESGKVILIMDRSHKYLLRHYKDQCKVLISEYGIMPLKLET